MSRVGASSINMDDIFGGITPTNVTNIHVDPEPSSRRTTGTSVSTVKEVPVGSGITVSHTETHVSTPSYLVSAPPPTQAPHVTETTYVASHKGTVGNDSMMDLIFSSVNLPKTTFNVHDDAIRHLDEALDGEDYGLNDNDSVASEPSYQAPSSHVSSHNKSSHVSSTVQNGQVYASAYHPQNTPSVHSNGGVQYSAYGDEPQPDYGDEKSDTFDSHHQYPTKSVHPGARNRTNTIDSAVSYAESRFGNFEVHDEHDRYTGETINLNHNEVAYQRPDEPLSPPSSVVSSHISNRSFHTGGTQRLRNLQREVDDAHSKRAQLSHQVDRQRADNDRLAHANLAREASLKVHRIGNGAQPHSVGIPVRSYNYEEPRHVTKEQRPASFSHHSSKSVDSSIYEEETVRVSALAAKQKAAGDYLTTVGKCDLIVPQYYVVDNYSKNSKINKVVIGGEAPVTEEDKTILLFGPVGSGKTSVVNSMLNYLYDVKKENPFRFVLDEHVSKTTGLTAYVFNNTVLSYNVTVVDTPGVADVADNKVVSTLIEQWLHKELFESGAFRLDAISIVLKHDDNQLGWPFIYELAAVKSMFGDDLKTNVLPIITHSEVLPQPIAVRSLTQANIAFLEYYKVNNSGFTAVPHGVSKLQHNLYWTHGTSSLENLFRDLQEQIHPLIAILRHKKGKKVEPARSLAGKTLY